MECASWYSHPWAALPPPYTRTEAGLPCGANRRTWCYWCCDFWEVLRNLSGTVWNPCHDVLGEIQTPGKGLLYCRDPKILGYLKRGLVCPRLPRYLRSKSDGRHVHEEAFRCFQAQPWPASTDGIPKRHPDELSTTRTWEIRTKCFNSVSLGMFVTQP